MKRRQRLRKGLILFSFFLFPATYYYLSPVLILEASAKGIVNGSFVMFSLLFLASLLLGRGFCGWVCPGAGCQEAIFAANDARVVRGDAVKWVIWVPWVGAIALLAARAGGYRSVDFLFMTTHGFSIGNLQGLIVYLFVLLVLIVLPAYAIGRRSFCHHLCWMAPFMILGRKLRNAAGWATLRLAADPERCKHCQSCTRACPMSLTVEGMVQRGSMEDAECILCGTCVDTCPNGTIAYAWAPGTGAAPRSGGNSPVAAACKARGWTPR